MPDKEISFVRPLVKVVSLNSTKELGGDGIPYFDHLLRSFVELNCKAEAV